MKAVPFTTCRHCFRTKISSSDPFGVWRREGTGGRLSMLTQRRRVQRRVRRQAAGDEADRGVERRGRRDRRRNCTSTCARSCFFIFWRCCCSGSASFQLSWNSFKNLNSECFASCNYCAVSMIFWWWNNNSCNPSNRSNSCQCSISDPFRWRRWRRCPWVDQTAKMHWLRFRFFFGFWFV